MTERTITEARFNIVKQSQPNARIEIRDGVEVVVVPTYDFDNDIIGEVVMKLVRGDGPRFKPGDVLGVEHTASNAEIVDIKEKLGFGQFRPEVTDGAKIDPEAQQRNSGRARRARFGEEKES